MAWDLEAHRVPCPPQPLDSRVLLAETALESDDWSPVTASRSLGSAKNMASTCFNLSAHFHPFSIGSNSESVQRKALFEPQLQFRLSSRCGFSVCYVVATYLFTTLLHWNNHIRAALNKNVCMSPQINVLNLRSSLKSVVSRLAVCFFLFAGPGNASKVRHKTILGSCMISHPTPA